jgi:hypothetical protein
MYFGFCGVWGVGLGGLLRIDLEPIRFDTLQFWHRFESMRDIAYFCQACHLDISFDTQIDIHLKNT